MTDSNWENNDLEADNDFVVIIENDENEEDGFYDFVTIDDNFLSKSVIIDMSSDEPVDSFIIDVELDTNFDSFITIEDQIFTLDFTENDFDSPENIHL